VARVGFKAENPSQRSCFLVFHHNGNIVIMVILVK
jgi:hypothetical protein